MCEGVREKRRGFRVISSAVLAMVECTVCRCFGRSFALLSSFAVFSEKSSEL